MIPSFRDVKSTDLTSHLTISFYLTTYPILIQGNHCGKWCREVFPRIKESVEKTRQTQGSGDSHGTIDDLLAELNASSSFNEDFTRVNVDTTDAPLEPNQPNRQQ